MIYFDTKISWNMMEVYFYIDGIHYYSTQDKLIMTLMIVKNNK